MELSRQEYWSGLPFLSPGDLPDPGVELRSPAPQPMGWSFLTRYLLGEPGTHAQATILIGILSVLQEPHSRPRTHGQGYSLV